MDARMKLTHNTVILTAKDKSEYSVPMELNIVA